MVKFKTSIMLSTVLLWLLNLVNASTEKISFEMLPIQVVKMTLAYLDIDDYFQTIQMTKLLYNQCYPDMNEVMYHHYLEWFHDPKQMITEPQNLITLNHYVAFLLTCMDHTKIRTFMESNVTLQLFTGAARPFPRILRSHANASTEIINYFSKHLNYFNYEETHDENGDLYEFAGGINNVSDNENKFGFPLIYDPIIPRLSIYHKSFADSQSIAWQKGIHLPTILVFTDTAGKQIHTERLSAYQCIAVSATACTLCTDIPEGYGLHGHTISTTIQWKIPTKEDLLCMYFDAEGVLTILTIYSEKVGKGFKYIYQWDNEYFIQGKFADFIMAKLYTKFYAFYYPVAIQK